MAARSDHHHCKVCGNVCAPDASFCSASCEAKRAETVRQRKNLQMIMYGGIAVLAVLLILRL